MPLLLLLLHRHRELCLFFVFVRLLLRHDRVAQRAQRFDLDHHIVALLQEHLGLATDTDARWRTGKDDISGSKGNKLANMSNESRRFENQLASVAVLHRFAVQK
jgi:hypothetical protein